MEIKKKIYLTSAALLVCFLVAICVLLPLIIKQIKQASAELRDSKQALLGMQAEQQDILGQKREYQTIKPEIDAIAGGFLARGRAVDFIVALEKLAQVSGNGYEIQVLENQQKQDNRDESEDENKAEKSSDESAINFQITLSGSFLNLLNFLARLDNMEYLNDVENIQIQRISQDSAEQGEKTGDIHSTIQIRAYLNPI